jgi:hypothetical protein
VRDKRMINPSKARVSYWGEQIVVALMILASPGVALYARGGNRIQSIATSPNGKATASPDVRITSVKALPLLRDKAKTEIEIRWTAQVPRFTTLDEFDVLLEVHYSDESRAVTQNRQLKSSARAILLALATHPRPGSTAVLKYFKASVNVRFRVTSSVAVVKQVPGEQTDSVRVAAAAPDATRPQVFITAAKLVPQGCASGNQCLDVKWTAACPRNITITEFTASVDAQHKDGTQTAYSRTFDGHDRQARLHAGPKNVEVESMKVSLVTSFSLLDTKTVVSEGTFSIDTLQG